MGKRKNKTEVAAIETETSEAVQMMANEMLDADVVDAIEAIGTVDIDMTTMEIVEEAVDMELVADVVTVLEAVEGCQAGEDAVVEAEAEAVVEDQASFNSVMASITDEERLSAAKTLTSAIDERAAFERVSGNDNIQKTLAKTRNAFSFPSTAAAMLACNVSEGFVNRSVQDGKRYNVYAFGKLADIAKALAADEGGVIANSINNAICRSLFAFRKAKVPFTGEMAKMAASDKIRAVDAVIKAILVRHTVSASTAPTQASSTMQALETLGIVSKAGSHRNPTYTLTDSPQTAKLERILGLAA